MKVNYEIGGKKYMIDSITGDVCNKDGKIVSNVHLKGNEK